MRIKTATLWLFFCTKSIIHHSHKVPYSYYNETLIMKLLAPEISKNNDKITSFFWVKTTYLLLRTIIIQPYSFTKNICMNLSCHNNTLLIINTNKWNKG
jgi:hypothetical protein